MMKWWGSTLFSQRSLPYIRVCVLDGQISALLQPNRRWDVFRREQTILERAVRFYYIGKSKVTPACPRRSCKGCRIKRGPFENPTYISIRYDPAGAQSIPTTQPSLNAWKNHWWKIASNTLASSPVWSHLVVGLYQSLFKRLHLWNYPRLTSL